jgi:Fe2+ or Zn2+ uptake regulation protein
MTREQATILDLLGRRPMTLESIREQLAARGVVRTVAVVKGLLDGLEAQGMVEAREMDGGGVLYRLAVKEAPDE